MHVPEVLILAVLVIAILPVGVPMMMGLVMYQHREAIAGRSSRTGKSETEDLKLAHLAVWFATFHPDYWWYAIYDLVRRSLFSGWLLLIEEPSVQVMVAFAAAVGHAAFVRELGPYWVSGAR